MDRERLALIIYKTGCLTVNEAEELIDKILAELDKDEYCYCSGVGTCGYCIAKIIPPKNKIEPFERQHDSQGYYLPYTLTDVMNELKKIIFWINKQCGEERKVYPVDKIEPLDWGNGACAKIPSVLNIAEKVDEIIEDRNRQ